MNKLSGNRGEWSEIYIFLKLITEGEIYAANKDMNKLEDVFLKIVKIIREETNGQVYEYVPGKTIKIYLNGEDVGPDIDMDEYIKKKQELWRLMNQNVRGNIQSDSMEDFLERIHITKLKAPAFTKNNYFGGTQDITMEVMDYRSGINSTIGFSCKSDFSGRATLFNASKDNTNFVYEVTGDINDDIMYHVNNLYNNKGDVAVGQRILYLKQNGCDIKFIGPASRSSLRNLFLSGGKEMPSIVGDMLKYYYWVYEGKAANSLISGALSYVIENNSADYQDLEGISSMYYSKVGNLLYNMFTGMRLGTVWNGRSSVNGGYIVAKSDGDVLAYHSCMADEFKDFLINNLGFETPSCKRHAFMSIQKEDGKYFIKFNLQIRFRVTTNSSKRS